MSELGKELSDSLKEAIQHAKEGLKLREATLDDSKPTRAKTSEVGGTKEQPKQNKEKSRGVPEDDITPLEELDPSKLEEPIWPMSDRDLAKWKKWMADAPRRTEEQKKFADENARARKEWETVRKPKLMAEIQELKDKLIALHPTKKGRKRGSRKKRDVVAKAIESSSKPRQQRLGQTKLIDELLDKGLNDKEIFDQVRQEIPQYPADKLPRLIKLRKYHQKKRKPS